MGHGLSNSRAGALRRRLLGGMAAAPLLAFATGAAAQPAGAADVLRRARQRRTGAARTDTAAAVWRGTHKIAFIPVYRPSIDAPPADWEAQIQNRIFNDPDATGANISLQAYFRAVSHGRADIDAAVLPRVAINLVDVPVTALSDRTASLREQGFAAGALVMLGGRGSGTAEQGGFWARFVMAERVGVWAMELLHVLTGYDDLWIFLDPADTWFDNMACGCGTHPSAFTKETFGWLDAAVIAQHGTRTATYDLHAVALTPPAGRVPAVRVGAATPYLMVEARKRVDAFESGNLPLGEGVIVYEVLSADEDPSPTNTRARLALRTRTPLAPGAAYTAQSGVQVHVTGALDRGYVIRIDDPNLHLVERSAVAALGPPSASVIPGDGEYIAYRGTGGQLLEVRRDSRGRIDTETLVLTGYADYPKAAGNPFAFADTGRNMNLVLYRDVRGIVCSLYRTQTGGVGHDSLSSTAGAPAAAGDPVGYYAASADAHHVVYRGGDGHLHELNWQGLAPVAYGGNLTAQGHLGAPPAAGDPSAFVNGAGMNFVVYRAVNGHIMSVYWTEGPSGLDNLSGAAGAPLAAGDPTAYYTAHNDMHHVVYLGRDGHLWELYWRGAAPVAGRDLTALSGAPPSHPFFPYRGLKAAAYYSPGTYTKHVIYCSADGRLHEIWKAGDEGAPQHVDITAFHRVPLAADRPAAFATEGPATQHVVYRGGDDHVYEVMW